MRLKEFITRSSGVITAIALLASMMAMAGASVPGIAYFECSICGTAGTHNQVVGLHIKKSIW